MKKQVLFSFLLISIAFLANAQQTKAEWVTIKSANLKCWECKEVVDKYLLLEKGATDGGVMQWKINLLQGEIKVQFLPDRASADGIRTALNNAGFDADESKATDDAYKKLPPSCKRSEDGGGPQPRKPCHVKPFYWESPWVRKSESPKAEYIVIQPPWNSVHYSVERWGSNILTKAFKGG